MGLSQEIGHVKLPIQIVHTSLQRWNVDRKESLFLLNSAGHEADVALQPSCLFKSTEQGENDDEGQKMIASKEEEAANVHQFSVLGRHGMKQFLVVQNHSCPQNDRRERIVGDRNGKAGDLAEKNV